jgi:hypothetical protein
MEKIMIFKGAGRSLAQLMAAFSVIAFIGGMLIMSPAGRFISFLVMAVTALPALLLGTGKLRIFGIIFLIIGIGGTATFFRAFDKDPYFVRAKLDSAYKTGMKYADDVTVYRTRYGKWPSGSEEMKPAKYPPSVKSISVEADGRISVALTPAPVADKSLILIPLEKQGVFVWTCSGEGISKAYLPDKCRQSP